MTIIQEFDSNNGNHRLLDTETQKTTDWAPYRGFTYLNGYVGFTGYYGIQEGVLSANDFCKMVGYGEKQ